MKKNNEKTYSILFIGNSYTFYNDMPSAIFESLARSAGYSVEIKAITKGGYTLSKHADPTNEYGMQVEAELSGNKKYDIVILQDQSIRPASENAVDFYDSVRDLAERARAVKATPMLYATWGRREGSSTLEKHGWTNEIMTWRLAAAYSAIGEELGISVAHAGIAFRDVFVAHPEIELYNQDRSHPSYAGSYLAAATLFATIFNVDPTEASFTGELSKENSDILLQAAKAAVFKTPSIPEEYKILSKGISNKN